MAIVLNALLTLFISEDNAEPLSYNKQSLHTPSASQDNAEQLLCNLSLIRVEDLPYLS